MTTTDRAHWLQGPAAHCTPPAGKTRRCVASCPPRPSRRGQRQTKPSSSTNNSAPGISLPVTSSAPPLHAKIARLRPPWPPVSNLCAGERSCPMAPSGKWFASASAVYAAPAASCSTVSRARAPGRIPPRPPRKGKYPAPRRNRLRTPTARNHLPPQWTPHVLPMQRPLPHPKPAAKNR
jgi:hypothetical protein